MNKAALNVYETHPPRRHAEERRRHHADARRAVRVPRLPRLRAEARRAVRKGRSKDTDERNRSHPRPEAEEIRRPVRRRRRQHRAVHRRAAPATTCTTAATTSSTSPTTAEFEEIAYLLVHGKLPNAAELAAYKAQAQGAARPAGRSCRTSLERMPAGAHPMDVMRTGVLGARQRAARSATTTSSPSARDIADRLMASLRLDAALLVPLQPQRAGASTSRPTTTPSAATSCTCCTARSPRRMWVRAMHTSLILYAEHEFNASHLRRARHRRHRLGHVLGASPAPSARCAARSTAAPTKSRSRSSSRYDNAGRGRGRHRQRAWPSKEIVIGFGHPVYTIADPRNQVIKEVARTPVEGRRRT